MAEKTLRFVCDRMLGALAKWLRLLGFDVIYPEELCDDDIDEIALGDLRILLTRDVDLSKRARSEVLLIDSLDTDEQLAEVDGGYDIFRISEEGKLSLTRCSVCNHPLVDITKEEARDHVPPGVHEIQDSYWFCPECGRYYWPGTHYEGILKKIETLK